MIIIVVAVIFIIMFLSIFIIKTLLNILEKIDNLEERNDRISRNVFILSDQIRREESTKKEPEKPEIEIIEPKKTESEIFMELTEQIGGNIEEETNDNQDYQVNIINQKIRNKEITTTELSRISGYSEPHISRVRNGKSTPSQRCATQLAKALKCTSSDIMRISENKKKPNNLAKLRHKVKMSQVELSQKTDIPIGTLGCIEREELRATSEQKILIASILNKPIDTIFPKMTDNKEILT